MALVFVITDAGRAALVNAAHDGTNAVHISSAGVSATAITPTPATTSIPDEIKRVATVSGAVVAADTIHLVIEDSSTDAYTVRSIALYLTDGTLFGIYGQTDPLLSKTAQSLMLLAADLKFVDVAASQISFGDTNFFNPPATTDVRGVVELATDQEAIAGADEQRAVTPGGMWQAVSTWLDARFGSGAPSPFIKGLLVSASAVAMRISLGLKSAATFDAGPGNGLDADTVDGRQAAEFALLAGAAFTGNVTRAGNKLWDAGNDGAGSGLDADLLDGLDSTAFAKLTGAVFTGNVYAYQIQANNGSAGITTLDPGDSTHTGQVSFWLGSVRQGYVGYAISGGAINYGNDRGGGHAFNGGQITRDGQRVWDAGNDGSGSGLDADLLDGLDSSAFAKLTGAAFTAPVSVTTNGSTYSLIVADAGTNGANLRLSGDGATPNKTLRSRGGYFEIANSAYTSVIYRLADDGTASFYGPINRSGNTVWDAGNDGSGSGLDADLLDGLDGSAFAKLSGAAFNGTVTVRVSAGQGYVTMEPGDPTYTGYVGFYAPDGARQGWIGHTAKNNQISFTSDSGAGFTFNGVVLFQYRWNRDNQYYFDLNGGNPLINFNPNCFMQFDRTNNKVQFIVNSAEVFAAVAGGSAYIGGQLAWNAGNDGSGSGLDADMLDGLHASSFLKASDGATYGSSAQGEWEKRANGLIEQWGEILFTSTIEPVLTVTLPIGMSDGNYKVQLTPLLNGANTAADTWVQLIRTSRTTAQFQVQYQHPGSASTYDLDGFHWRIIGK